MTYKKFSENFEWFDLCQNIEKLCEVSLACGFEDLSRIYAEMWGFYYYDLDELIEDVLDY